MPDPTADKYGIRQTARLTGATTSQLRYWNLIGLVPSTGGGRPGVRRWYSFADLVVLRAVVGLKDSGCSIQRIRRLWQYLQTVVTVDPPFTKDSSASGNGAVDTASDEGLQPELIPALRTAVTLGIPRTEDLTGDLDKGQAMFVEMLADVVEEAPSDRFWLSPDFANRVTAQRDHLRLTASG